MKDKIDYNINPNTKEENEILSTITTDQSKAESMRTEIDRIWDDEYKIYIGDQWSTSFANRPPDARRIRPNSVDNFVMPAVINIHSALTSSTPPCSFEPRSEDDAEIAQKVGPVIDFIEYKNKFPKLWKKLVLQGLAYGPLIGAVLWDNTWTGGTGPNRWAGDVRLLNIKRKEFYPDPAIVDLEDRLQDCSYIHRKLRRKVDYFKERWEDKGQYVEQDMDTVDKEGTDAGQATLIERWTKGKPKMIPDEWVKFFKQKAQDYSPPSATPDSFKAKRFMSMAKGSVEGIHVCYSTRDVFLEYIPYVYDDGLYPFVYKVMYEDEKSQWGFGEIRNIKIPQVMHNKADEIEIEAMSVEGLGGMYYNKGALSNQQLADYKNTNSKGGASIEVNDIGGIKERTGPKIPASIANYKEQKQRMVETISQNTPIQQGYKPGGVTAFSAIKELGDRADTRTRGKLEVLEDFLIEFRQLELSRVAQFYTEERQWRITGSEGQSQSGTFSNKELIKTWPRNEAEVDENGNETKPAQVEEYIPEMDVRVKLVDERPTSRDYYTNLAIKMEPMGLIDRQSFWYVMDEGKFPPKEEVLKRLDEEMQAKLEANQPKLPPLSPQPPMPPQESQVPQEPRQPQEQPNVPPEIMEALAEYPPEIQRLLIQMDPDKLQILLDNPDQVVPVLQQMMAQGGQQ